MATANMTAAKASAQGVLGKEGKIPAPKTDWPKLAADKNKADKEYDAAVDVLQKKIVALQTTTAAAKIAIKQYDDQISKTDFGLDENDADAKKKIAQAQKILGDVLDIMMGNCDTDIKNLGELDKHTMAISKYESAS